MDTVQITRKPNGTVYKISLRDLEWIQLNPDYLEPFQVQELIRKCDVYEDGLFPGAELDSDRQVSRVVKFRNYLEWSKITLEDVVEINGNIYLTANFFNQRSKGWSELTFKSKSGKAIGYCFNGTTYSIDDQEAISKIVYKTIYWNLIKDSPVLKRIENLLDQGFTIELSGVENEFLEIIRETFSRS